MWKNGFFPSNHFSNDYKLNVLFELHPHIGETSTEILVYEKGGLIEHIKAPARFKIELPDLWQNKMRDYMESLVFQHYW